ncbi:MAG: phosphoribosyl-AMP cyclohydrolase [Cellvibrionaceae bacterium]
MENAYFKSLEEFALGHTVSLAEVLGHLQFNQQGVIPVITQQHASGEVLMLAWMNREALEETLQKGQMCYWSRSRQALWYKGESSGNIQRLIEMRIDCDGDTVLCLVDQTGPACHTNRPNCFYLRVDDKQVAINSEPVSI